MDSCHPDRRIVRRDESARQRRQRGSRPQEAFVTEAAADDHASSSWNHSMTFDGRLFLSKIGHPPSTDRLLLTALGLGLAICLVALYACYFHFDLFHYHVTSVYAGLGHPEAQHLLGDKLLHGKGVDKDEV